MIDLSNIRLDDKLNQSYSQFMNKDSQEINFFWLGLILHLSNSWFNSSTLKALNSPDFKLPIEIGPTLNLFIF